MKTGFFGRWQRLTLGLWLVCFGAFFFADTEVIALEPWNELGRMAKGFISPDFLATDHLFEALWQTVSFALLGVALGLVIGIPLSLVYHRPWVAAFCAFIRAIHELFWATAVFAAVWSVAHYRGVGAGAPLRHHLCAGVSRYSVPCPQRYRQYLASWHGCGQPLCVCQSRACAAGASGLCALPLRMCASKQCCAWLCRYAHAGLSSGKCL